MRRTTTLFTYTRTLPSGHVCTMQEVVGARALRAPWPRPQRKRAAPCCPARIPARLSSSPFLSLFSSILLAPPLISPRFRP